MSSAVQNLTRRRLVPLHDELEEDTGGLYPCAVRGRTLAHGSRRYTDTGDAP